MVICVHIRIPDFFWNISYLGGYFISNKQLQSGAYLTYLKLHHEGIHNTADYGNEIEGVPAVPKIALISRRVYIRGFRGRKANREIRSRVKQNGSKVQFTWDQNILHTGTLTHYMTFITMCSTYKERQLLFRKCSFKIGRCESVQNVRQIFSCWNKYIAWNTEIDSRYPASEGGDFQETLNGEKEREEEVRVTADVAEYEGCPVVLSGWECVIKPWLKITWLPILLENGANWLGTKLTTELKVLRTWKLGLNTTWYVTINEDHCSCFFCVCIRLYL